MAKTAATMLLAGLAFVAAVAAAAPAALVLEGPGSIVVTEEPIDGLSQACGLRAYVPVHGTVRVVGVETDPSSTYSYTFRSDDGACNVARVCRGLVDGHAQCLGVASFGGARLLSTPDGGHVLDAWLMDIDFSFEVVQATLRPVP
jgi:hypothetical protein